MTVAPLITLGFWLAASGGAPGDPRAASYDFGWPSGADSAVVRSLSISRGNIFDPDEPTARHFYARLANALHVVTREHVIRRGLYFAEGDTIAARDLGASVRRLRTYPFLKTRVDLQVLGSHDSVDVAVATSDVWSTRPEVYLSRSGGLFDWACSLRESNLLGLGKELSLQVGRDDQKSFGSLGYADRQLLGSLWQLSISVATGEDLDSQGLTLWRPFDRPTTPWGLRGEGERYEGPRIDRRGGLDGPEWETKRWAFTAQAGLRAFGDEHRAFRVKAFTHLVSERYTPPEDSSEWVAIGGGGSPGLAEGPLRERQIRGLGLLCSWVAERYRQFTQIDALGRYEDIDLGSRFEVGAAYSAADWGALDDGLLLRLTALQGVALGGGSFLRLWGHGLGLLAEGRLEDTLIHTSVHFHSRWAGRHTVAFGARGEFGIRVAPQRVRTLGAHNGLRGFDAYRFWGERMAVANVEERMLIAEDLFGLVSMGIAAFANIGTTWLDGAHRAARPRAGAGIGLRLQASRTSGVLVTRLDLGYPVLGGEEGDDWVFSFASGQAF